MSSSASNPGIIYALVARGTCVLAEFTTTSGNFTTVTRRILEKLPSDDSKMSYARLRVTAKAATPPCAPALGDRARVQHLKTARLKSDGSS